MLGPTTSKLRKMKLLTKIAPTITDTTKPVKLRISCQNLRLSALIERSDSSVVESAIVLDLFFASGSFMLSILLQK